MRNLEEWPSASRTKRKAVGSTKCRPQASARGLLQEFVWGFEHYSTGLSRPSLCFIVWSSSELSGLAGRRHRMFNLQNPVCKDSALYATSLLTVTPCHPGLSSTYLEPRDSSIKHREHREQPFLAFGSFWSIVHLHRHLSLLCDAAKWPESTRGCRVHLPGRCGWLLLVHPYYSHYYYYYYSSCCCCYTATCYLLPATGYRRPATGYGYGCGYSHCYCYCPCSSSSSSSCSYCSCCCCGCNFCHYILLLLLATAALRRQTCCYYIGC